MSIGGPSSEEVRRAVAPVYDALLTVSAECSRLRGLLAEWLDVGAAMGGGSRSDLTARTLAAGVVRGHATVEQTLAEYSPVDYGEGLGKPLAGCDE
jgi:hypothetical protein